METLGYHEYAARLLAAARPHPGGILAFYDHRVGCIGRDAALLLIPLDDHLCHRGDGIFESIAYRERRLFQLDAHLERMRRSAAALDIAAPCPWEELRAIIIAVAVAAGEAAGNIRVLIGRGAGGFGVDPAECPTPSLYVVAIKAHVPDEGWYARGLTAFRSAIPAKQEYLARIKNTNYLPNVLMTAEARKRGMDVALCFDAQGFLAEAATANVALVDTAGALRCPDFSNSLPGTTLLAAMDIARAHMPVEPGQLREADIFAARELLLLSSTPLCVGVTHYENTPIGAGAPGPVTAQLRRLLLEKLVAEGCPF